MAIRLVSDGLLLKAFNRKELVGELPIKTASRFKKKDLCSVFQLAFESVTAGYLPQNKSAAKPEAGWHITCVDRSILHDNVFYADVRGRGPEKIVMGLPEVIYLDFIPEKGPSDDKTKQKLEISLFRYRNSFIRQKLNIGS